jgi:hypothetical protein
MDHACSGMNVATVVVLKQLGAQIQVLVTMMPQQIVMTDRVSTLV